MLLDPDTVARVIHRASAFADDGAHGRHGDGVSVEALIEAASEVGIPAAAVRRALALERLDPAPSARPTDRIVGPATVTADAEVAGSAAEALAHLDAWLVDGHHLRRDHLRDGRGRWTKRTDIIGAFVRALRCATGEGRLGREVRLAASTSETGSDTTMVRLAVDRSRARQAAIAAGVAVATVAVAATIAVTMAVGPLFLALLPVGLAAGFAVASAGRRHARRWPVSSTESSTPSSSGVGPRRCAPTSSAAPSVRNAVRAGESFRTSRIM